MQRSFFHAMNKKSSFYSREAGKCRFSILAFFTLFNLVMIGVIAHHMIDRMNSPWHQARPVHPSQALAAKPGHSNLLAVFIQFLTGVDPTDAASLLGMNISRVKDQISQQQVQLAMSTAKPQLETKPSVPKSQEKQKAAGSPNVPSYKMWITPSNQGASIRVQPGTAEPILKQAKAGEKYPVLSEQGGWYKVEIGQNQTGWISSGEAFADKDSADIGQSLAVQVVAKNAAVLNGPGSEFAAVSQVGSGKIMNPVKVSGMYVQVSDADGHDGWIPVQDVEWLSESPEQMEFTQNAAAVSDNPSGKLLSGKIIVIDPGHGGKDTGAIGVGNIYEKSVNLAASLVLEQKLQSAGARVIMTRASDEDVSLDKRVQISNENKADAFVSIHQNMYPQDPSIQGTMTYFYFNGPSRTLADDIEKQVNRSLQWPSSKSSRTGMIQEELYVTAHNKQPAVLVEGCFLSNPQELADSLTVDYEEKLADGIFNGLLDFFK